MDIDKEIYKILSGGIISIVDTTDGKKIVGIASASEVITDFIENLLEQEKKRVEDESIALSPPEYIREPMMVSAFNDGVRAVLSIINK
jgi:hypothetical protein